MAPLLLRTRIQIGAPDMPPMRGRSCHVIAHAAATHDPRMPGSAAAISGSSIKAIQRAKRFALFPLAGAGTNALHQLEKNVSGVTSFL